MSLIVQKYGGATLATPEKIKSVAQRIKELHDQGKNLVVVVSAMGKTTNQLIELANQVTHHPLRRELDMLLSTGERISMSLLSMALNDLGCPAISFTGSQAGVLTDDAHLNAFITDIKPFRIEEAIKKRQVVVLAGFQGVSPVTKEITTLGRGGSDTTAVAMAAALKADRCEILKDVPAVFTADPNVIKNAKPLQNLTYDQLAEMTFWGAKVLHYRSVELSKLRAVPLYIGPAHSDLEGTRVKEKYMFESTQILSLNSHENVLKIEGQGASGDGLDHLQSFLIKKEIAFPQVLTCQIKDQSYELLLTGTKETVAAIQRDLKSNNIFKLSDKLFSTVTATCTGATTPEVCTEILKALENDKIKIHQIIVSSMSVTAVIENNSRNQSLACLHKLIGKNFTR